MSATITWVINALDVCPQSEGQINVVRAAHWTCSGIQGEYSAFISSTCGLAFYTEGNAFTPYAQLTHDQMLDWIWASGVDKDLVETQIQEQIDAKISPVVQPALPWV